MPLYIRDDELANDETIASFEEAKILEDLACMTSPVGNSLMIWPFLKERVPDAPVKLTKGSFGSGSASSSSYCSTSCSPSPS